MTYVPQFTITPTLLAEVEQVAALRERIQSAVVDLAWVPALQKDTRRHGQFVGQKLIQPTALNHGKVV